MPDAIFGAAATAAQGCATTWWVEPLKALGSLGGFAGVILTLIYTAWVARNSEAKQNETEGLQKAEDLRVFKIALLAALTNLESMLDGEIKHCEKPDSTGTWVPLLDYFELYRRNMDKIGLLSASEVGPLSSAYYIYHENAGYIARLSGLEAGKEVLGVFAGFSLTDVNGADTSEERETRRLLLLHLRWALSAVETAVQALSIAADSTVPDLPTPSL